MESQPIRDELQESAHVPQMSAQIRFDEQLLLLETPPEAGSSLSHHPLLTGMALSLIHI